MVFFRYVPFLPFFWFLLLPLQPIPFAAVTCVVCAFLFYRMVLLCFKSGLSRRLSKEQRWLCCLAGTVCLAMVTFPPWSVRRTMSATPEIAYEPIYMGCFSKRDELVWIGPDLSAPPLTREPKTWGERRYVKYIVPNRILTVGWLRLSVQLGVVGFVSSGLFYVFRRKKIRVRLRDAENEVWVVVASKGDFMRDGSSSEQGGGANSLSRMGAEGDEKS